MSSAIRSVTFVQTISVRLPSSLMSSVGKSADRHAAHKARNAKEEERGGVHSGRVRSRNHATMSVASVNRRMPVMLRQPSKIAALTPAGAHRRAAEAHPMAIR